MWGKESILIESYRKQRLQEAEHERLVREVLANTDTTLSPYQRVVLWFGHLLILWGVSLHNRYGRIPILLQDTRKLQQLHQ